MQLNKYVLATLVLGLTGCDTVGKYVATILPENGTQTATSKLAPGDDGEFIDPTQIGTQPNSGTPRDLPIGNNATELYQDPTQSSAYKQMMGALEDPTMDPGQEMGAFAGEGEYSAAMAIDEFDLSEGVSDPTSQYQQQIGNFSIPETSEGGDVTSQYLAAGGLADPAESQQDNQHPAALYLRTQSVFYSHRTIAQSISSQHPWKRQQMPTLAARAITTTTQVVVVVVPSRSTVLLFLLLLHFLPNHTRLEVVRVSTRCSLAIVRE